jgi:hypothetical protein
MEQCGGAWIWSRRLGGRKRSEGQLRKKTSVPRHAWARQYCAQIGARRQRRHAYDVPERGTGFVAGVTLLCVVCRVVARRVLDRERRYDV